MGILRSDRVSGLGGANAINGSAFFSGGTGIETAPFDDLYFGTNALTMEMWVYFTGFEPDFMTFLKTGDTNGANSMWQWDYKVSDNTMRFIPYVSDSSVVYASSWTPVADTWYHIAVSKSGTSIKLWVDGTQIGSTHTFSQTWDNEVKGMAIGHRAMGSYERDFEGYMSNLRIINGTALYTANFTPPTTRLEKTSDTVFLAFQSPGDVLKEETGKILYPATDGKSSAPAVASRFAPDKGEDHGTTFEDNTRFDTLSYMVPPGGTTAQSNRGRALIAGGTYGGGWGTKVNTISYIQIQSGGIIKDFGDLSSLRTNVTSVSSSTRAVYGGGSEGASANNAVNTIEYVTIATSSNVTNFGDLTSLRRPRGGVSNNTRGLFGGGYISPAGIAEVDHVTIATTANATDFGDLSVSGEPNEGSSNSTRGVWMGGGWGAQIDYVTIASTGSGADFGDVQNNRENAAGASSSTRALLAGGGGSDNSITYITIATLGNDTDFGDLTVGRRTQHGTSNGIRGIFCGGYTPDYDIIDSVIIATTGNAVNYGDLTTGLREADACSDSHGGIS